MLTLRAYQDEALAAVDAAEARGVRRQLGVAATGLGKTVMFTALARQRNETRTLILAHRDELIDQAIRKVRDAWPEQTSVGKVKAADNQTNAHVVVASVQTLARSRRLEQLTRPSALAFGFGHIPPFGLVVVDEAHHAAADSYQRILEGVRAGESDGPLLLGVTATPDRGDGQGLSKWFEEIVFTYDLLWGIRAGYLCDMRGLRVRLERLNLSDVKVRRGDYDQGQAGRVLEDAGAPELIVKAWHEHAANRRTLVFTPTVELARLVRDEFASTGVPCGFISGETEPSERARTLRAYSTGELRVLANCAVLTEGYDEPRTDCIVIARPTKSRALYTQMVGRGTRLHPDKTDCLVLDVVGASAEHSLVTIASLFGLRDDARKRMEQDPALGAAAAAEHQAKLDVESGRLTAEDAELFHVMRRDGLAWVQVHTAGESTKRYAVGLGKAGTVILRQVTAGEDVWHAGWRDGDGQKHWLAHAVSLEMAQGVGEEHARRVAPDVWRLMDPKAAWRSKRPSEKQVALAERWRIRIDPTWTAGQLSDAIDQKAERARARKGR